jgi:predicted dehydrogenase
MAIRVGLVGLNYGARVHLPAFRDNPKFTVAAVCARTPGRAEQFAREHNIPAWHTDARRLIASPDVDLVSLATPPGAHAGLAAAALAAGKHVVVEIAFVPAASDARVLADMAREMKRVAAAAFVLRYVPNLRLVSDLLRDGVIGQPRLMRMDFFAHFLAAGEPGWRWLWEAETGGGVLSGFIAHGLDLALGWFGPVCEVEGVLRTFTSAPGLPPGREPADDSGLVTLHFESGLLAAFQFSAAVARRRVGFEVHGSGGSLRIAGFGDQVTLAPMETGDENPVYPPAVYLEETRGQSGLAAGFESFAERLALAVTSGQQDALPTFADGLAVTRVLDAIRLAARERRRVRVEEVD